MFAKPLMPERIETARLVLRIPALQDMAHYIAYYTGNRTGGVGGPISEHKAAERFMTMVGQWALRGYGRYAITDGTTGFGHVGLQHALDQDSPDMTWTLWDAAKTGHGYATEAAAKVIDVARTCGFGPVMQAHIEKDNKSSQAVATRLGGVKTQTSTHYEPDFEIWELLP